MQKKSSFVGRGCLLLGLSLSATIVFGQATVCNFSSAAGVAFGVYDDSSSMPRDTATNMTINCTRNGGPPNVSVTLALGPSATSGSSSNRSMRQGNGSIINYNLFRDSSRGLVWGQTPGVDTITNSLSIPNKSTVSISFTIFGRISALQNASVGTYGDSVMATISY